MFFNDLWQLSIKRMAISPIRKYNFNNLSLNVLARHRCVCELNSIYIFLHLDIYLNVIAKVNYICNYYDNYCHKKNYITKHRQKKNVPCFTVHNRSYKKKEKNIA